MKRANYRLLAEVEREHYEGFMTAWHAHVRWIRLHLVYFKGFRLARGIGKKLYQEILTELENIARAGLAEDNYEQPSAKELRRVMRLFAVSARRGRQGKIGIQYMLNHPHTNLAMMNLQEFVVDRLDLKPLAEN